MTIFRRQKKKKTILCVTSCSIVFVLVRISGYYHRICLTFPTTNFVIGKTPSTVWDKASSLQLLHLSLSSQVLVLVSQGKKILVLYFVVVKIFQQNKRISLQCWHWQFLNRPSFKAVEWKAIFQLFLAEKLMHAERIGFCFVFHKTEYCHNVWISSGFQWSAFWWRNVLHFFFSHFFCLFDPFWQPLMVCLYL